MMSKSEESSRWNPIQPAEVTPEGYERQVVSWLRSAGAGLSNFSVTHLKKVQGQGGEYSIDGWIECEILGGAKLSILVECKRHGRPLERDVILGVAAKARDVGAQKCLIFSTSGFQRGAVDFATSSGIALVNFVDGKSTYVTRSRETLAENLYPTDLPRFAGQFLTIESDRVCSSTIADDCLDPLVNWLASEPDLS